MKKVRILSAVMAILMLPLATLFACGETIILTPDPETIIDVNNPPKGDDVTPDNDGTKDGYHLFYTFDAHVLGNLKGVEPYTPFITTTEVLGGNYVIKAKKDSATDKALEIIRAAGSFTSPEVTFDLKTISAFGPKHVIEFDLRWEKGLIMDMLTFKGSKTGDDTPFLKADNNGVYDGGGTLLYNGEPGWLKIQIAIDDEACVYDLYINGVKKLHRSPYVTTSYVGWDEEKAAKYVFTVAGGAGFDVTCGIDNFGVRGIESLDNIEFTSADITYKDSYKENVPFITVTHDGVVEFINNSGKAGIVSTDMGSALCLSAIKENGSGTADDEFIDVQRHWGYENGAITEIEKAVWSPSWIGNMTFDLGNGEKLFFSADPDYTVTIGDEYVGTYSTETFSGAHQATIKWANDKPYKIGEFEMKDAIVLTETVGEGDEAKEVTTSIVFYEDGFREQGSEIGTFNVTETTDPYVYNPVIPEGATPVFKFNNFATIGTVSWFPEDLVESFDPDIYDSFVFTFYATKEMVEAQYTFLFQFITGKSPADGKDCYYSVEVGVARGVYKYTEGWNTIEMRVTDGGKNREVDWSGFQKIAIAFGGWSNGPFATKGTAADGCAMYIKEFGFKSSRSVVVDGPETGKEGCTHTAFTPVEEPVPATCVTGSYYLKKCNDCGATMVDTSRDINLPNGHNYEGAESVTVDPTCDANGYTYITCVDCKFEKVTATTSKNAHEFTTEFDWNALIKKQTCKICGLSSTSNIVKEMPTIPEKVAALEAAGETIRYFYCDKTTNTDYIKDGTTNASLNSSDVNFAYNMKYAKLETVQLPNGDYGFEHTRYGSSGDDSYIELNLDNRFGVAASHVVEFSLMLGKKSESGSYTSATIAQFDRNGVGSNCSVGTLNTDGTITLGGFKFTLSDEVMNHFIIVFKPKANAYDVYINSELVVEGKTMYSDVATSSKFLANDFRIANLSTKTGEIGASYIFNDFIAYTGDGPINLLPEEDDVIETTGDVTLLGSNNAAFTGATISNTAVKATLPNGVLTTKYVMEMDLSATGTLADGALMNIVKLVKGFEEKLAVLEVKNNKLYSMGVLVADTINGAKVAVVCDDQNNVITVYVNGTAIITDYKYTAGAYADASEYINNVEFEAVGNYTVSNFKFYTGTAPKAN
jgi:hypothetical protein